MQLDQAFRRGSGFGRVERDAELACQHRDRARVIADDLVDSANAALDVLKPPVLEARVLDPLAQPQHRIGRKAGVQPARREPAAPRARCFRFPLDRRGQGRLAFIRGFGPALKIIRAPHRGPQPLHELDHGRFQRRRVICNPQAELRRQRLNFGGEVRRDPLRPLDVFPFAALRRDRLAGDGRGAQQFVDAIGAEVAAQPPLREPGRPLAFYRLADVQGIVDILCRSLGCLFAFLSPRFAFGQPSRQIIAISQCIRGPVQRCPCLV